MAVKADFQADTKSFVDQVEKADKALAAFGNTADKAAPATKQWSNALGQVDSVLSQFGVNVGPASKALDELSTAAGKSAADIGLLGTAGLAVGAAMAGWQIGRAIADFFKLDEAIANTTARLLGYGDVVAETSGAQQDTINAAIRNGAAATISYSEAIKFNTDFHRKRLETVKEANKADEKTKEAMTELNSVGGTLQQTLATMNGTVVEAVKYYLAAGVSQSALQTAYGLTAAQVKAVAASMAEADAADKAWLETMKAAAAEAELYGQILQRLATDAIDKTIDADKRAIEMLTRKTDAITASILAESNARASLQTSMVSTDAMTTAWVKMTSALEELEKSKVGDIDTTARQQVIYREYIDTVNAAMDAQAQATETQKKAPAALDATTAAMGRATQQAGVFMNQLHMLIDDPKIAQFFGFDAKGAVAATLYGGGSSGITPEMAAAMAAGQFINTAGVGAVHNTFNVNGTAADVARTIADQIMRTMKSGSKIGSS